MTKRLMDRKHLLVVWDGVPSRFRKWKCRRNSWASSVYAQAPLPFGVLEIVVWYR